MNNLEVSVIIPCYNEAQTIRLLLDALVDQSYPTQKMEIVIADGMSTDRTREEIADFASNHPELTITIVDNPKRNIPAALNRAIEGSRGEIIVRLDAHSIPNTDYIERCVGILRGGIADNVGGIWNIRPRTSTWIAQAIAEAAAHPLGVGDAQYRHSSKAQYVDTVPFGSFKRSLLTEIGKFDETLLTNEDYEYNVRIRKNGGRIWLDPAIQSTYFARSTLRELAIQYLRYGFWKGQMLKRYPETLRWRQVLPPLFVFGLVTGSLLSIFWAWPRLILVVVILIYLLLLLFAGLQSARKNALFNQIFGVPIAIGTMHICWGSALLWSFFRRR